jgi:hypothetical protein
VDAPRPGGGAAIRLAFFDVVSFRVRDEGEDLQDEVGDESAYQVFVYASVEQGHIGHGDVNALYSEVFAGLAPETEGRRLIGAAARHLVRKGQPWLVAKLFWQSLAKYRGFRLGLRCQSLPKERIMKCTANPGYWQ